MSNEKLAEALRDAREYVLDYLADRKAAFSGYEKVGGIPEIEASLAKIDAALQAHAAEAAQQAAEPVAVVECNANGQIRLATPSGDAFDMSRYVGARFYTHPQPAQDAKDEATIERVARAIYEHVFTMSIPRMGVRSATFEEVWAIPSERERLTAQACAAIDTAMAKESGR